MSFSRAFQCYHSHLDPIWPDGTFKTLLFNPLPHCGRPYLPITSLNALKVLKARYSKKLSIPQAVT